MRKLAILSFSFAAAVFSAVYMMPEGALLPAGGAFSLLCPAVYLSLKSRWRRAGLALSLACAGLALGLLWTAAYTAIFFRPARALDGRTVELSGEIIDFPQEEPYGWSVPVRVETGSCVRLTAVLYTDQQGAGLRPGDRIAAIAHCTLGDRSFAGEEITYYVAKGIFLRAEAYGRLEVERSASVHPRHWAALLSRALRDGIGEAFPADAAPLVQALVTGNRDNLTDEFTTSLQRTGLSHTVAVSGMHLAFLACLVTALLGRGRRAAAAIVAWVVLFCGVAGNTPSVLRAGVMILLLQFAPLLRRERDGPTALGLALLLLLAQNPFSAAHVGLQLSFGAVAGILMVSDRIQEWMQEKLRLGRRFESRAVRWLLSLPRFLVSALSATLGASVFTIPLVALHFRMFSLISPLSNLLTLWAVAILFMAGLAAGTAALLWPAGAAMLAIPFTPLAHYLDRVVGELSLLPLASIPLNSFYYRTWVAFLCLLVGLAVTGKGRRLLVSGCAGAFTLALSVLFTERSFQSGELAAAVLDVGQGQSVLLRTGGRLTLVDCGGDGHENAGDVAADYIQSLGRGKLDLLVVSHCHADHANGVPQLLRRLEVSAVALPDVEEEKNLLWEEILALAQELGVRVWPIRKDTHISLGEDQTLTLYAPLGGGADANELGLTVLATAGSVDILLTGDMGGEVEKQLLEHAALPDIELLVAGHHGSGASTTQELLDRTRPEMAVISAGTGNPYGHPAQETLKRLERAGAEIYRTDLQGTVAIHWPEAD